MEDPELFDKIDTQDTGDTSIASEDAVLRGHDDESTAENSRSSIDGPRIESKPEEKPAETSFFDEIEVEAKPNGSVFVNSTNRASVDCDLPELTPAKGTFSEFVKRKVRLIIAIAVALFAVAIVALILGLIESRSSIQQDREVGNSKLSSVTETPTISPTINPTFHPTVNPTFSPTATPSLTPSTPEPTISPTISHLPTSNPSASPSLAPSTLAPTVSAAPTATPSFLPSKQPSFMPTQRPTPSPTFEPTMPIPIIPLDEEKKDAVLNFCVIADAPYTEEELQALPNQIATQMEGCEFLVHLGDIFAGDTACDVEGYEAIQKIMLKSEAPAFVVPGDNEWNDCFKTNIDIGWDNWASHFIGFEDNWKHDFSVVRQPEYEENFYFIEKRTLIVGLNIVGGRIHNATEWRTRHLAEFIWVREVLTENLMDKEKADGVILMAHANPKDQHGVFFDRLRGFIRDNLKNEFPVLYLHGDGHAFLHTQNFYNQPNFLRIQHEGGTIEPVLKIKAGPSRGPGGRSSVHDAFQYDRQLHLMEVQEVQAQVNANDNIFAEKEDQNANKNNKDKEKDDKNKD